MIEPAYDEQKHRVIWIWERCLNHRVITGEQLETIRKFPEWKPDEWPLVNRALVWRYGDRYRHLRDHLLDKKNPSAA